MERDLGVRDKNRRDEGMGNEAFCTEHTLDGKADKNRIKFNRTIVMAVTDETCRSLIEFDVSRMILGVNKMQNNRAACFIMKK